MLYEEYDAPQRRGRTFADAYDDQNTRDVRGRWNLDSASECPTHRMPPRPSEHATPRPPRSGRVRNGVQIKIMALRSAKRMQKRIDFPCLAGLYLPRVPLKSPKQRSGSDSNLRHQPALEFQGSHPGLPPALRDPLTTGCAISSRASCTVKQWTCTVPQSARPLAYHTASSGH
jgi:hypothetical protein